MQSSFSPGTPQHRRLTRYLCGILLIMLAGFAVRIAVHDFFGLDGDDMYSLLVSRNDPITLVTGLLALRLDIHPPLHYLALKGWVALAGDSLVALRMMNILLDMIAGSLIIRLCSRMYKQRGG